MVPARITVTTPGRELEAIVRCPQTGARSDLKKAVLLAAFQMLRRNEQDRPQASTSVSLIKNCKYENKLFLFNNTFS